MDRRILLGVLNMRGAVALFSVRICHRREALPGDDELGLGALGDTFEALASHYFITLTLANLGRISEALEVLEPGHGDGTAQRRFLLGVEGSQTASDGIHRENLQDPEGALAHDRNGAEMARSTGVGEAEVNSVINLVIDHFQAGDRQQTDSSAQTAGSLLARDAWFRWRFVMGLRAARAEQTLSRPDALALLEQATHYRARKYMADAHRLLARIAMAEGDPAAAEAELRYPDPAGLPGAPQRPGKRTSRWAGCKRNSAAGKRRGRPLPKRLR